MAPHKGVETVVRVLSVLKRKYMIDAELYLVGGWSTRKYRNKIEGMVDKYGVRSSVYFTGHVTREELLRHYADATVFCLMSRCESFGIPSIEAQFFGTPVVSSNCCAIPGVCGLGGIYPEVDDIQATAENVKMLLTDKNKWKKYSHLARENALRYRYKDTAKPLMKIFDLSGLVRAGAHH